MKNLLFKIFFIVTFWVLIFLYVFPRNSYGINIPFSWNDYKLWLDLQWWIELDYKIDLEEVRQEDDYNSEKEKSIIEWLKSIIDKRVEALNINDSVISSANYWWEQHIIVQIPLKWNSDFENKENIKRAKEAIWRVVKIEFKELRWELTEEDVKQREELADNALKDFEDNNYWFNVVALKYKDSYENVVYDTFSWSSQSFSWMINLPEEVSIWLYDKVLSWTWQSSFSIWEDWQLKQVAWEPWYYIININDSSNLESWAYNIDYLFISKIPSEWKAAEDSKWRILNDKYFTKSAVRLNQAWQAQVELLFNDEWKEIFWELTKRLVWQPIAIFVWWSLLTAPRVNEPILNWSAVITWDYSIDEAKKLSQDINTWVVPAPIYLTSERTIDSKLWSNSLEKLIIAWISWFIIIFLFLIYIYRISWLIASIALFIYVILVLAIVKTLWIVLTLASIAWLILSIGMAIDANILIFERIKDELYSWKKFKESLSVWFKKSWTAIWDSNITWLIVAIILFIFWINMIKWFWLMLWLWIIISLFTVMRVSKVLILAIWENCKHESMFLGKIQHKKKWSFLRLFWKRD